MKYTFLTSKFYSDYPHTRYPQLELKEDRPYAHIKLSMYNQLFCLPLRSHIAHPHAYFTNKKNHYGVDYSKAVVIENLDYIDTNTQVRLRPDEHKRLLGKEHLIKKQFSEYIELYKRAKTDLSLPHREDILKYSTLQYFEKYICP